MATTFSHEIRVLSCQSCGAPIEAALTGGQVKCGYCSSTLVVSQRDERADYERARSGLGASISESERYAQLRLQDGSGQELPESLRAFQDEDGSLAPALAQQAASEWQQARQQIASGSQAFSHAERLFYLTILLAEQLEEQRARALLETAAELLQDERHRHVVRCTLARRAAQNSEVAAAEAWLATCNPRPTDLTMDTAYRHAAATLAVVQQNWNRLVDLLGTRHGDVPLADREELSCDLLRAHGLEAKGELEAAGKEIDRLALAHGETTLERRMRSYAPLVLCPVSLAERDRRVTRTRDETELLRAITARARSRTGVGALLGPIRGMPFLALVLLIPIAPIRCTTDSDPLLGVYGLPLCPHVCEGCFGPTRTVTEWTHSGNESSTNGAEYFCNSPSARVDRLSDARLLASTRELRGQELGFMAAAGGSYVTLLALLTALVPISGFRRHRRAANANHSLDAQIRKLCEKLGRELPDPPSAGLLDLVKACMFPLIGVAIAAVVIAISLST